MPSEPSSVEKEISHIVIRIPNGERLERSFRQDDLLQIVYDYVDAQDIIPNDFILFTNFPRCAYTDMSVTLRDAGLVPSAMLFIEEIISEDE